MAAPSDPLFLTWWDHLKTSLEGMSEANGYHYDYGDVLEDDFAALDVTPCSERPPVVMTLSGEIQQDATYGGERSGKSWRHFTRVAVAVPIEDEDGLHSRKAARVHMDLHTAVIGTTDARARGSGGRVTTHEIAADYQGNEAGGVLAVEYAIRWDHVMGNQSSQ